MNIGFIQINIKQFGIEKTIEYIERRIRNARNGKTTVKVTDEETLKSIVKDWELQLAGLKKSFGVSDKN